VAATIPPFVGAGSAGCVIASRLSEDENCRACLIEGGFSDDTPRVQIHVVTDSDVERRFVEGLDTSSEVVVYAKLPRGFLIPTPVGDYNPGWAISFKEGSVKYVYFVAETKVHVLDEAA
jgi:restriction endonuclease